MAMHIEQPGSRHSAPAARTISWMPSASASRLTISEPGTTSMRTPSATRRPRSTCATSRMSLRRPLVHEPTNTTSTGVPASALPAWKCM
ncbi:hypothetical protein G6F63_016049 [Rhizopus arrhizus]|nr:hypothetical protein G6F63_016049 [Rhizopus arrhizus]